MGKVPLFSERDYLEEIIFIGHFAHWSRTEILEFTLDELLDEYDMCIELHNALNTPPDTEEE